MTLAQSRYAAAKRYATIIKQMMVNREP